MPDRQRLWGFPVLSGLMLLAALLLGAAPVYAQDAASFTVHDVRVDVTADNVNLARQQAFAKGQRDALDQLVQRFTTPEAAAHLPQLTDTQVEDLVLDVGVDQEKRSNVRYIATLSVRFKSDGIRQLLRDANVAMVEWRGRPVAVLPVLKTDNGPLLWEAVNPWRDAWKSSAAQGLVPLVVPQPPSAAQASEDALQAATAGPDTLNAFAARYNTQDVLVVIGVVGKTDDGHATLDVTVNGIGALAATVAGTKNWLGGDNETVDSVMHRAVIDIAAAVNAAYKADATVPAGDATTLSVMAPIDGLPGWTQMREKLARTPAVRSYEVGAISQSSASLVLHYVGQQQQLESMLVQNGLVLSWADDHWVLQVAIAKPTGTAASARTQPAAAPDAASQAPDGTAPPSSSSSPASAPATTNP
jgi:hypothetical protein